MESWSVFLRGVNLSQVSMISFFRKWLADPLNSSTEVTATLVAGVTSIDVNHGLGRAMNGAFVVACSPAAAVSAEFPVAPANATQVRIQMPAALAFDVTVKMKVF